MPDILDAQGLQVKTSQEIRTGLETGFRNIYGDAGGEWRLNANLMQESGRSIHAGNGATGTFNIVNVVDGIVISGS